MDSGIKILFLITLLSLAPSILLLMTCFTRVAIVLGFVRSALQLQGSPGNQIIVGLSLFITFFIMAPVWDNINRDALKPYQAQKITGQQALDAASGNLRDFMLKQTRPKDVELFVSMAKLPPTKVEDLPLRVVTPAFIISELRTAFQMGFLDLCARYPDRHRGGHGADEHGHDDDAAHDHFAAVEAAALCARGWLVADRAVRWCQVSEP